MATPSQGTHLFVFDGTAITRIECFTDLELGDDSTPRIDVTCIDETDSKDYINGLRDPGEGSIGVDFDENNASHLKLVELATNNTKCEWYVGSSNGTDAPTASGDVVTLPTTRTWWGFKGFLQTSTPKFAKGEVVKKSFKLNRTTSVTLTPKTT